MIPWIPLPSEYYSTANLAATAAEAGSGPANLCSPIRGERKCWRIGHRKKVLLFSTVCLMVTIKVFLLSLSDPSIPVEQLRYFQRRWIKAGELDTIIKSSWNVSGIPHQIPIRHNSHLDEIDCPAMLRGDTSALNNAREYMKLHEQTLTSNEVIINQTNNCEAFRLQRGYISQPLSKEEADFPIAFSILMYKDLHQIERLLRAIYHPQNFYCIHVDRKASQSTRKAAESLVSCLPNVFLSSRSESVFWGHISIIYAEMNCIQDLLKHEWKYFINLSGQMFPLHTNRELVKILKLYNGANDIEGTYKRSLPLWLKVRQLFSWRLFESLDTMLITMYPKGTPPHNITIYKGSNQVVMSRKFAVYFMSDPKSQDLVTWFADTLAPDEYIWPTLNHNPHLQAPGSYVGDPEIKPFIARVSIWLPLALQINWSWDHWDCQGKWVREICIFGVGDLPWLKQRPELFANKFHSAYEWLAYDCMEELIFNKTIAGDNLAFDSSYYERLPFVSKHELVIHPS